MKISIVTPNYNYGRFLQPCIDSVLQQLEADPSLEVEHIITDGGSTDETLTLLKAQERKAAALPEPVKKRYSFRYVSEPDKGQTDAINKGLRMATGDAVCWLNADEYYQPGGLARIQKAFVSHPDADFIYGEVMFVDSEGKPVRVKRDHVFSRFVLNWYGCFIPSCCSFWRRKIIDDGHLLNPSYKVIMDGEYWSRLASLGYRFRFMPANIAAFTWHDSNVSLVFAERRKAEAAQIRELYTFARKRQAGIYPVMLRLALLWRMALKCHRMVFLPRG